MAEATKEEVAVAPAPKPGIVGKVLGVAGMFAATLVAVVAGGFINAQLHAPPEYVLDAKDNRIRLYVPPPPPKPKAEKKKKAEPKEHVPALFYSLDPPLVVNFEDASAVRFLQVGVDVMSREATAIEAVQKLTPLIRNNLLQVISNRDYQALMSREGKEELRSEALKELRKIMKKEAPESTIEDLLFTSFIVQ